MTKASDWRAYAGYYTMPHLVVRLKEVDGRLALALPGVPDGYEMLLAPQGDDVFVLQRGPLAGRRWPVDSRYSPT